MQIDIKKTLKASQDPSPSSILGKGWISLRGAFAYFWKRRLLVLLSFLIVFVLFCVYFYIQSLHTSSTIVSLDYEEASQGLTPSQTRFNIYEIESVEVMERLIDYAGLQDEITPEELSKCISVNATHSKNVSGKVNFISTSYVIQFTNNSKTQKRCADTMLAVL